MKPQSEKPSGQRGSRRRSGEQRRQALDRGRLAETLAVWLLRLKGYRILGRDLRLGVGEIDILARRGRVLAAIEVKRREELTQAGEAVTARQRARVTRALERVLAERPALAGLDLRFDAILVVPGRWPRHLPDAWRPETR
jgi:putative endonuclease